MKHVSFVGWLTWPGAGSMYAPGAVRAGSDPGSAGAAASVTAATGSL